MNVKTDTKEKFHVITIQERSIAANMTAEIEKLLLGFLEGDVRNVVLNCKDIQNIDDAAGEAVVKIQQSFYDKSSSFVVCELQPVVEEQLDKSGLLELLNATPSETEAWDIIQMEEIERELMDGEQW
ncbi:MAG: STAS domain-containing protein [Gemmatimonadaceae bacterium]|nr:STAS domain-containing protein [Chitinophagaceae bacterium]